MLYIICNNIGIIKDNSKNFFSLFFIPFFKLNFARPIKYPIIIPKIACPVTGNKPLSKTKTGSNELKNKYPKFSKVAKPIEIDTA